MLFKISAIGDPHFKITNTEAVRECIDKILKIVRKEKLNFTVLLGDLLDDHEKIHTNPLNLVVDFVEKLSQYVKVFIVVGNHDMINHDQFLTKNHWMNFLIVKPHE